MEIIVYVLSNQHNSDLYVGITNNLRRRLKEHNTGTSRYTKAFIPWKVIYEEKHPDYSAARTREKYLKTAAGKKFLRKQISGDVET
jgi:putative endonuclease